MKTRNINIPLSFNQLVDIVRQLSPKEKIKLTKVLLESNNENEYEISEEHKNIVKNRIKASEADPSRILNWEEVKHKLKV